MIMVTLSLLAVSSELGDSAEEFRLKIGDSAKKIGCMAAGCCMKDCGCCVVAGCCMAANGCCLAAGCCMAADVCCMAANGIDVAGESAVMSTSPSNHVFVMY